MTLDKCDLDVAWAAFGRVWKTGNDANWRYVLWHLERGDPASDGCYSGPIRKAVLAARESKE